MSELTPRERALEQIRKTVLDTLGDCEATVYLFGSCARAAARRSSDIDVAIEAKKPLPSGLLAALRESLEESTIPFDVDIVDLSETSPAFRERVKREGVVWRA